MAYADDVDLMSEFKEEVGRKVAEFRRAASRVGLNINEDKTKLMKVTREGAFVEERLECGGLGSTHTEKHTRATTWRLLQFSREVVAGMILTQGDSLATN